jgi:DNA-binding GntR family transcriptional regulator
MSDRDDLQQQTYRQLKQGIADGDIGAGSRLSEPELAVRFGVSRSPIREALLRLEQDGFVVRSASGRMSVAPLELDELESLYVVRANLEGLATRLAASRLRTIDLEQMGAALEEMRRRVAAGEYQAAVEAGGAFHDVILRECANQPLVDVLDHLKSRITRFRSIAASFDNYDSQRIEEHRRILDALFDRDAARAEQEMVRHITQSAAALMHNLRHAHRATETTPMGAAKRG